MRISDVCRSETEANMGRGSARAEPDIVSYTRVSEARAKVQRLLESKKESFLIKVQKQTPYFKDFQVSQSMSLPG